MTPGEEGEIILLGFIISRVYMCVHVQSRQIAALEHTVESNY